MTGLTDPTEITDNSFIAEASGADDPPPPIKGLKRLMISIVPANIAVFMVWGAVPGILLPQQVTEVFGDKDQINLVNLAIISTIGAFGAMIAQPIAGQLSDRTRSRLGRRAPWILLGSVIGALALIGLALASSLVGFIVAWTIVQVSFNLAQGPLSAIMPDRVPQAKRGSFSAMFGVGMMVGGLGGGIIGSLFFHSITVGYFFFAAVSVLMLAIFVALNPDYSSKSLERKPFNLSEFLSTFWVNPIKHPDFFWAFTGRLLLYTAYFLIIGYQLYMLQYYFKVEKPEEIIPLLSLISLVGIVLAIAVSGPLSDKVGRRKPFVFASSVVVGLSFLLPWLWPEVTAWMIMMFIAGLGFGMFQAVDTALISQVLPFAKSFGKDLGVVNIAATLPQTVAPAIAGAIALTVGYVGLFPVAILIGILGGLAIVPIKSVK
ncbi:MAG: MFS transporter [Microbacteriaceae bacterium]|nr:MFS transporter [Microbacteriaceae bacterium]